MIAYYEKNFANDWNLVAYADKPFSSGANGAAVERHPATFKIPESCMVNGVPDLRKVEELFPNPSLGKAV